MPQRAFLELIGARPHHLAVQALLAFGIKVGLTQHRVIPPGAQLDVEIGARLRQVKDDLIIIDYLDMLQQFLHDTDLHRHRVGAHVALQGMHHVLGGEFAPAKVPLDALPEVKYPRLAVWTHAPVGGQHRHEMVPRVFLHQGFVHRRILGGIDDGHEYRIILFALQLHCHL